MSENIIDTRLASAVSIVESLGASSFTMLLVGAGMLGLLGLVFAVGSDDIALVATLASLAAVSGESTINATRTLLGSKGPAGDDLTARAHASNIAAVLVFGGALSYARGEASLLTRTEWLALALVAGLACGGVYALFTRGGADKDRILIGTVGVVTLASGLAAGMGISPLFVNVIVGVVVGSTPSGGSERGATLARLRAPTEVFILIAVGATASAVTGWAWIIPVAWILARITAWFVAPPLAETLLEGARTRRSVGPALAGFGPIGAAIALNHAQVLPHQAGVVIAAASLALLTSDVLGPRAVRRVLADLGEVDHGRAPAPAPHLAPGPAMDPGPSTEHP